MDPNNPVEITEEMLRANPTLAFLLTLFAAVFLTVLLGVFLSWMLILFRWWKGQPLLPTGEWHPRPWGFTEIILAGCCLVATQVFLTAVAARVFGIEILNAAAEDNGQPLSMGVAALVSTGYLITVFLLTAWIWLRFGSNLKEIGWSIDGLPGKLAVGFVGGLAFLPCMFVLNALVSMATEVEYNHPVLDAMKAEGSLNSFLLASFSAVLVAPVAEEFLFRVLLQGWLQSVAYVSPVQALVGRLPMTNVGPVGSLENTSIDLAQNAGLVEPATANVEYSNAFEPPALPASPNPDAPVSVPAPPIWPALLAGTLFGLAHWGYGLSFIPLIGLGVFLGLLYRATQSIWPCILVHFMLNASSMLAMGLGVYLQKVAAQSDVPASFLFRTF